MLEINISAMLSFLGSGLSPLCCLKGEKQQLSASLPACGKILTHL